MKGYYQNSYYDVMRFAVSCKKKKTVAALLG